MIQDKESWRICVFYVFFFNFIDSKIKMQIGLQQDKILRCILIQIDNLMSKFFYRLIKNKDSFKD